MKTIIVILYILMPTTTWAGNLWEPGTSFNPYVIKQTGPGQQQVTTQFPDLTQDMMAPGQPWNPYVIQKQPNGTTTLQSDWPNMSGSGASDAND
jgi:hypothetical protein